MIKKTFEPYFVFERGQGLSNMARKILIFPKRAGTVSKLLKITRF